MLLAGLDLGIELGVQAVQGLGHGGVDHRQRQRDGLAGTHGAELELVAREGEGAGAVAVRGVLLDAGQVADAEIEDALGRGVGRGALLDGVEDVAELGAEEHGHDGRRRLVGAQAVVVAGAGDGGAEQAAVGVDGLQGGAEEVEELQVLLGRLAGLQQVLALVRGQAPVHVLAAAVDAGEGLLVEQDGQAMPLAHGLEELHEQLVVVAGDVGGLVDGRDLELVGGHLVVAGLGGDAELEALQLDFLHEAQDALLDAAEVVVLQLLALGGLGALEGAVGEHEVRPLLGQFQVHGEVLLLGAALGHHRLGGHAEVGQALDGPPGHHVHGAQQGHFVVQGLAVVPDEGRGDAEGLAQGPFDDEGRAGGIPGGVAPGLEGGAQAAAGEGAGVGLALDELAAAEALDDLARLVPGDEGVVLLGGGAGHGQEPVGEVGAALLQGPILHGLGDALGHFGRQGLAALQRLAVGLVDILLQPLAHGALAEGVAAEVLADLDLIQP